MTIPNRPIPDTTSLTKDIETPPRPPSAPGTSDRPPTGTRPVTGTPAAHHRAPARPRGAKCR